MKRGSGLLIHVSSLPSKYGVGDFGNGIFSFIDILHQMRQRYLQILPLTPVDLAYDCSPYHSISAFAGNQLFISLDELAEEGLLSMEELSFFDSYPNDTAYFKEAFDIKQKYLYMAFSAFKKRNDASFEEFCWDNAYWLEDYALFKTLKAKFNKKPWFEWPEEFKRRDKNALDIFTKTLANEIDFEKFIQFMFYNQWKKVKNHANGNGISIIGDIPIYVDLDSSDVWSHSQYFKLNENGLPLGVAGVPPDYFSSTGQLWGNPVYNWEKLKEDNFSWWIKRFDNSLKLYDFVRIDHFRGLIAFWEVPYGETTAINGTWIQVPTYELIDALKSKFTNLPVIAEDLGLITQDVTEAMKKYDFPGMKVLQFAFGGDATNPYLPHNFEKNSVVYTGTHDNNTSRGWFESEATEKEKINLKRYIGHDVSSEGINWELVRLAISSVSDISIFPVQDIMGLGSNARMNIPGTAFGNWRFRFSFGQISEFDKNSLKELTEIYGR